MNPTRAPLDVTLAAAGLALCLAIGFASPGVEAAGERASWSARKGAAPPNGERGVAAPAAATRQVEVARRDTSFAPEPPRR